MQALLRAPQPMQYNLQRFVAGQAQRQALFMVRALGAMLL
jgi:hypothetical protein